LEEAILELTKLLNKNKEDEAWINYLT
jgi:hypothetical protein